MRFCASQRLRRSVEFRAVREQCRRLDCGAFTLWVRVRPASGDGPPALARAGMVASRAAVGDAPSRNRAKRRMRELFRRQQMLVPAGYDLMFVARSAVTRLPWSELEQKFIKACQHLPPVAKSPEQSHGSS
jgi:ribonuclease P protein component